MTRKIQLQRTGQAPLEFEGQLLSELTTRIMGGGLAESRWHEVDLYRTDYGAYIAHVVYGTQWIPAETPTSEVIECAEASALIDELRAVNPSEGFVGRPERGEAERATNAPKNSMVTSSLRKRWEALISEAAEALGVVEVRRGPGRPSLDGEPLVQIGIKVPQSLREEVDRDRGETGISEYVRSAIEHYLARDRS